tara:strand:- start:673 stop:933 length:261 start_codon:yes stop_codon:yes gene_type:complete
MDTSTRFINATKTQITPEEILSSGKYFSGSIYHGLKSWIEFNLVNKEKMSYILNEINFKDEVKFEIFSYAEYPKDIQQPSNWDKLN